MMTLIFLLASKAAFLVWFFAMAYDTYKHFRDSSDWADDVANNIVELVFAGFASIAGWAWVLGAGM